MSEFDFIVVGSGFGGAVAACRLAEAGQRVLVLERGREWDETNYPSVANDNWVFDVDEPERYAPLWTAFGEGVDTYPSGPSAGDLGPR